MALINPLPPVSQDGYLPNVIEGHGSLSPLIGQICHPFEQNRWRCICWARPRVRLTRIEGAEILNAIEGAVITV